MHKTSSRRFAGAPYGIRCPHCFGRAYRIKRRLLDRAFSLFGSVRRYWCYECQWQGNLRAENVLPFSGDASRVAIDAFAVMLGAIRARRADALGPSAPVAAQRRALAVASRGFGT